MYKSTCTWMAVVGEVLPCEREVNNLSYEHNVVFVIFLLMLEFKNFLKTKIS